MALVRDTGAVFGLYDADDAHHEAIKAVVEKEPGPLFLPVVLLAEIDYLLTTRLGQDAALEFLESVEQGAYQLVPMTSADLRVPPTFGHLDCASSPNRSKTIQAIPNLVGSIEP